jgi:hypothetical protein
LSSRLSWPRHSFAESQPGKRGSRQHEEEEAGELQSSRQNF